MAEGAPLLREYTLIAYRGFESLLLRHLIKSASLVEAFLIGALTKRDENRRFDQVRLREYLAPSRMSGEARRARTAPRLFWVIPPSPPLIKKGPSGPFFMMLSGRLEEGYRTQIKSDGLQPASANATYFHLFRIFL